MVHEFHRWIAAGMLDRIARAVALPGPEEIGIRCPQRLLQQNPVHATMRDDSDGFAGALVRYFVCHTLYTPLRGMEALSVRKLHIGGRLHPQLVLSRVAARSPIVGQAGKVAEVNLAQLFANPDRALMVPRNNSGAFPCPGARACVDGGNAPCGKSPRDLFQLRSASVR
jgi:hypothetical protein